MSQSSAPETKKPYDTPELTKVGGVEEITKGSTGPLSDAVNLGSH